MQSELLDTYVHKTVERRRPGVSLRFQTSLSLFSSNTVDAGTNLLLRMIDKHAGRKFERALDLGCGYGPLGASLKESGTARHVDMVDRDALAVEFARRNVGLNGLDDVEVFASLGTDDVSVHGYDLIAANLPGKAGEDVLQHLAQSAWSHLSPGGQLWGVVVSPLWPWIEQALGELNAVMLHVERGPRHVVFGCSFDEQPSPGQPTNAYLRDGVEFVVHGKRYEIKTSQGVHEFDGLNYATHLLLEQLNELRKQRFERAVVFNVSQGYVPVALKASRMVEELHMADRDLLALRTTQQNIAGNELSQANDHAHHRVSWLPHGEDRYGLMAGVLRGDEPRAAIEIGVNEITERLEPGGTAVISGESTPITRVAEQVTKHKEVRVDDRQRYRGFSVVRFIKT